MSGGKLTVAPHVKQVRVEEDFVLMDLESGVYLGLDAVASQVWESLSDHGDLERAVDDVCGSFDVERERARADIDRWVGKMVEKGLLVPSSSDGGDD